MNRRQFLRRLAGAALVVAAGVDPLAHTPRFRYRRTAPLPMFTTCSPWIVNARWLDRDGRIIVSLTEASPLLQQLTFEEVQDV